MCLGLDGSLPAFLALPGRLVGDCGWSRLAESFLGVNCPLCRPDEGNGSVAASDLNPAPGLLRELRAREESDSTSICRSVRSCCRGARPDSGRRGVLPGTCVGTAPLKLAPSPENTSALRTLPAVLGRLGCFPGEPGGSLTVSSRIARFALGSPPRGVVASVLRAEGAESDVIWLDNDSHLLPTSSTLVYS